MDAAEAEVDEPRTASELWLDVAEAERRLLAQRLHDDVGQRLTGVVLFLRALMDRLESSAPDEAEKAGAIMGSLRETLRGIRRMSSSILLVPPEGASLGHCLATIVPRAASELGIRHVVETSDAPDVRERRAIVQICRLTQEAMIHATERRRATEVCVRLGHHETAGALEIVHDGDTNETDGIDARAAVDLMRRRAEVLGGRLTSQTRANGRTQILCTFALAPITRAG